MTMSKPDFTLAITLNATPGAVFAAILDIRSWWSGVIDGSTDQIGAEFRYRYQDMHHSTQRVTELVPNRKLVWHVLDSDLTFIANAQEWKGTDIMFELTPIGANTKLTFTHIGLRSSCDCYEACSSGWTSLIEGNLRKRVTSGGLQPDVFASSLSRS